MGIKESFVFTSTKKCTYDVPTCAYTYMYRCTYVFVQAEGIGEMRQLLSMCTASFYFSFSVQTCRQITNPERGSEEKCLHQIRAGAGGTKDIAGEKKPRMPKNETK